MKTIILLTALTTLMGCTADQQARFTAGYYGESGHTFAEAMSDTAASALRGAGNYAQGYSNAYNEYQYTHPSYQYCGPPQQYVTPQQHGRITAWGFGEPTTYIDYFISGRNAGTKSNTEIRPPR